ncbi:PREDICTED: docking protein 1 [Dinoponera quadriceps]|uniref:Docking protein 1 n=1 Tax=Dinoponera quadriceps TaxID=609295 RepID=A0A6P3Y7K8_DINQU|nr:PREDICTED: docking protein 1 [Dinoponera quadriceps]
MEPEEPLMQGILLLPPQGMLGQLKKTWHKRFCQLFRTSNYGIKRVEIYDNQEEAILQSHSPRIVTLDACIKIAPSNQSHVFTVVTKSGIHYFGCYSELEMTQWITAFQLVAFKDSVSNQTIEENNDLYCTSGEDVFSVKVVETDASKRCGLEARNYTLVVAAVDMKLMDGDIVLFTWPYRYIRRYGYRDGKFIFEAGRKCESGEGSFRLEHSSQQEIFRCMYSKMRSMKKLLNEENNPSIDCNDAQYHAALSMEPGSRAALPPSPNNSSNLIDIDFSSQNSQKQMSSSSSGVESTTSSTRSIGKQSKPAKPPRKYMFGNLLERKTSDSEFLDLPTCGEYRTLSQANSPELSHKAIVDSAACDDDERHPYDLVEIRNDAWKTHGIDSVHHTERVNSGVPDERDKKDENDDFQYEVMMPVAPSFQNSCKSKEIIAAAAASIAKDESDYDKLERFGSVSKLSQYKYGTHSNVSHGENVNCNLVNPAWSNYDIVEDMSAVRLADDSHLGYGIIRKKTDLSDNAPVGNTAGGPQHKVFNNSEYAIVSKPKRV